MTVTAKPLGPGLLTIGETGDAKELSVRCTSAAVEWERDKEDDIPVLSGDEVAGEVKYSATLKGKILQDFDSDGLLAWSWQNKGEIMPCIFVPRTDSSIQVTGNVRINPFNLGGDVKKQNDSDFELDFIGEPVLDAHTPVTSE